MARLKEYNGHYCESEYEYAFIGFLEAEGWKYSSGNNISRVTKRDVLIADDFKKFIADTNPDLTEDEVTKIYDNVRLVGAESDFATLHKVYGWMVNGVQFTPQDELPRMIPLIDFDNWNKNIFRVVNQFTVEYTNNGQKENRRPDVLLFVNGIPLCVIELKNPTDANATIYDAWEQINIRYWRDIPHLLHYCPLACISDGVKTRLGTVRTPYEHFYAWRRVNEGDAVSTLPFAETETMIKGVYSPERFLEIFRDYIYFQDSIYDSDEQEIVCRYPQFFATRLLKQSIIKSVVEKSGKGGTYFGATGCGKTYTMAFLARQLALRCTDIPEIGSPTIILIVDRDELQKQGSKLFTKSKEFLNLGEVSVVKNRAQLRQELGARQSGGFYICTIQKFCDREDDKIGLINDRQNIICFSDEAHRTQLEHSKKIQFSKDADENMKAMVSKPYAKVLKEAFPHATFVGFTGTPIAETYQTFGDEIDRYTMDQAVVDGLTVSIKYHPRIAKVLLDNKKVKEIENYYKKCADDGATYEDIEASKKAMSSMEIILGEPSRLERLATDIHNHYVASCAGDPDRIQKATSEVDADTMNRAVSKMVEEALKYNQVESVLESGEEEDIFSPEYFEKLSDVKMPATKLELLVKMLRKQIKEYGKVNQLAAKSYQEMLEKTIAEYHERRKHLTAEEAGEAQEQASEDVIKIATEQALAILRQMNENRESFRKIGLTFEEKAFYDILISLRDQYNFEYGTDKEVDGVIVNDKCKALAKKIKDIIDTKSSFADWLNNQNVRNGLKLEIKICLVKNGYPPQYSPEVFNKVMEQVENFEEYSGTEGIGNEASTSGKIYEYKPEYKVMMVAEDSSKYGDSKNNQ